MGQKKRYEKSFKLQAARLVADHGYSYADVGKRLGVTAWSVRSWLRQLRASGELPAETITAPGAEELKGLRDENRRLRMENEILKKATAYFAKDSL